jgi:predicted GIY-YIG superfamily endonuclease
VLILPMLLWSFQPRSLAPGGARKRLLYSEVYEDIRTAIAREKQLKGCRRAEKLNLIRTINPEFKDLAVHEKM